MHDIVAVSLELENKQKRYCLTWGRIQDAVQPEQLESIVLAQSKHFDLGGSIAVSAKICTSLKEASSEIMFYEHYFDMCQTHIPYGEGYEQWRVDMNKKMNQGKELYFLW